MIAEWDTPFLLTSPRGTLAFNDATSAGERIYILDPEQCEAKAALRATRDSIPQGSGSILHREYVEGVTLKLVGRIMETRDKQACGAMLREMWDELGLHTNALLCELTVDEAAADSRRIQWTPTDYGQDRILGQVRMFEEPSYGFDGWSGFQFTLHSPFPYALDQTALDFSVSDGTSVTIDNPGNCPVYPNVKVYGAVDAFTYTNETTGLSIVYDEALPGGISIPGGQYGFFGHFANNAFLNGDEDNLDAGIDITSSDFFPLLPGSNEISADGADIDVLWAPGWRT